jgi:hypothetical protein
MATEPRTLQEAVIYFADQANCREYLVARRWPKGVTCSRCGSDKVVFLEKYNRWQCSAKHDARHRTIGEMSGFPVNPPGIYTLQLYVRKQGDEAWSENPVSSCPLVIGIKEEGASVNTNQSEGIRHEAGIEANPNPT